jgi:hypothetical protein
MVTTEFVGVVLGKPLPSATSFPMPSKLVAEIVANRNSTSIGRHYRQALAASAAHTANCVDQVIVELWSWVAD